MTEIASVSEVNEFMAEVLTGKSEAGLADVLEFFTKVMRRKDLPLKTRLEAGAKILTYKEEYTELMREYPIILTKGADGIERDQFGKVYIADE